jgi:hypothetical protein
MNLKNPVRRRAASSGSIPAAYAREARDCGEMETTTARRPPLIAAARTYDLGLAALVTLHCSR